VKYWSLLLSLWLPITEAIASEPLTHCGTGEDVFFSCAIEGSSKAVSLCGETDDSGRPIWVQYRFGPVGRSELVFPLGKADALGKFGGVRQSAKAIGLTVLEVWFRIGAHDYLIQHTSGGDCEDECKEVNDLIIFKRGATIATLSCESPVSNNLWALYGHISDDQSRRP